MGPTRMGSGMTSAVARSSTMLAAWTLLTLVLQPPQQPPQRQPQQQHLQQQPPLVGLPETPQLLPPQARPDIEMKARRGLLRSDNDFGQHTFLNQTYFLSIQLLNIFKVLIANVEIYRQVSREK